MSGSAKRIKSNVWEEFTSENDFVICIHCDHKTKSSNIQRMMQHIVKSCPNVPAPKKEVIKVLYMEKYVEKYTTDRKEDKKSAVILKQGDIRSFEGQCH